MPPGSVQLKAGCVQWPLLPILPPALPRPCRLPPRRRQRERRGSAGAAACTTTWIGCSSATLSKGPRLRSCRWATTFA